MRWPSALASSVVAAAPAILGYALLRAIGLLVLWVWSRRVHADLWVLLDQRYDAVHYLGIVARGYDTHIAVGSDGRPLLTNLAFFPLYPALIRVVAAVSVPPPAAALIVSWLASLFAAWGLFQVGGHVHGRRAGVALALLWGVLPHALVESMAYTESLFTALAAWALYAVLTRRWLTAGGLCCLAGLTRPSGVALAAALALAAGVVVWQRRGGWRPLVAAVLGISGWAAFVGWVAIRLGRLDGYFYVQNKVWLSGFDGGRHSLRWAVSTLTGRGVDLDMYVVLLVVLVGVLLFVIGAWSGQPLPLLAYSAAMLALTLGTVSDQNKARLLLPAYTLLLPVASALARARLREACAVLAFLAAVSAWFGGYLALIWGWSP
jgi:hypothetical protein